MKLKRFETGVGAPYDARAEVRSGSGSGLGESSGLDLLRLKGRRRDCPNPLLNMILDVDNLQNKTN
jgi:hypothetical protein